MFLQILMLTKQNKCHAAYFFNTRVLPNGFLCSEVLTECEHTRDRAGKGLCLLQAVATCLGVWLRPTVPGIG